MCTEDTNLSVRFKVPASLFKSDISFFKKPHWMAIT